MEDEAKSIYVNFGEVIKHLKAAPFHYAERKGWNGKGMYIFLHPSANENIELPYLKMRTADGKLVPWLASQTDILAEDWCIGELTGSSC